MTEQTYKVVEQFVSINGEGTNAGKLAAFIRFAGCNLRCSYCDTMWANEENAPYEVKSAADIAEYIKKHNVYYVTLTGGEPLFREGMPELVKELLEIPELRIEFETNGSISIEEIAQLRKQMNAKERIQFTLDYKLPTSGMNDRMLTENYQYLEKQDTIKFVSGSEADLDCMRNLVKEHKLSGKCSLYISPVFGKIDPADMVAYMMKYQLNDVTMQLQMHKFIWDPEERGV